MPVAYTTVLAAPVPVMANVAPASLKPDGFQTGELDCCGQPGGCGRCCYVGCCMPCVFGDVAASLPPGRCVAWLSCSAVKMPHASERTAMLAAASSLN